MVGGGFILFINLLVGALLCAFFLVLALHDRRLHAARWFAAGYAFGIAYAVGEAVAPFLDDGRAAFVLSFSSFLAALTLLNIGIATRYGTNPRWLLLAAVFVASLAAFAVASNMPRESMLRMFSYQTPFFLMQAIGAWIVLSSGRHGPIDLTLATLLGLSGLHFLLKPFAAVALGGVGATSQDYLGTVYALFSQSMGAVFVVATALMLMTMLVGDMLREAAIRTITDPLSRLLNRRGFETGLHQALREARRRNVPLALILADLDNFKHVNDRFGHAAGDNAIVCFSDCLRSVIGEGHLAGRIGGEEFAVLLRGADISAARLIAEGLRVGFSAHAVPGIPEDYRLSASCGVAILEAGEDWAAIMHRADRALYQAKAAGRDRVVLAHTDRRSDPDPIVRTAPQRRSEA